MSEEKMKALEERVQYLQNQIYALQKQSAEHHRRAELPSEFELLQLKSSLEHLDWLYWTPTSWKTDCGGYRLCDYSGEYEVVTISSTDRGNHSIVYQTLHGATHYLVIYTCKGEPEYVQIPIFDPLEDSEARNAEMIRKFRVAFNTYKLYSMREWSLDSKKNVKLARPRVNK
jgi:hypothetical protein